MDPAVKELIPRNPDYLPTYLSTIFRDGLASVKLEEKILFEQIQSLNRDSAFKKIKSQYLLTGCRQVKCDNQNSS